MPYAHNGQISQSPIDGGIEITDSQYQAALAGMLDGKLIRVDEGFEVVDPPAPESEPTPAPESRTIFAPREFLKKFTMAEYAAARTHTNIGVQWALDNLIGAQFVNINDPDTIAGLDLMVGEGVITPERRTELLTPEAAE